MRQLLISVVCVLLSPTILKAEYSVRYVGTINSTDETLIDASSNGWVLTQSQSKESGCLERGNLAGGMSVDLCGQGLYYAVAVNRNGVVVGTNKARTQAVVWGSPGGLKALAAPVEEYSTIDVTGINDQGTVVGYSSLSNGDEEAESFQAYRWNSKGAIEKLGIPYPGSTKAVAINNRGEVVVLRVGRETYDYKNRLYVGVRKFAAVPRRGLSESPGEYLSYTLNDRGQIVYSGGFIYSPTTKWRKISGVERCDRCDYGGSADISNSGQALVSYGLKPFLLRYPRPPVGVSCLVPQNRAIKNSTRVMRSLNPYVTGARFVSGNKVLFSTDVSGDNKFQQLFLLEDDGKPATANEDYCPEISVVQPSESQVGSENDCVNSFYPDTIRTCTGRLKVSSTYGALVGIKVKLFARQLTANRDCPEQRIATFTTTASGVHISVKTDPSFDYVLTFDEPKFAGPNASRLTFRYGTNIDRPIEPCRKPLEVN